MDVSRIFFNRVVIITHSQSICSFLHEQNEEDFTNGLQTWEILSLWWQRHTLFSAESRQYIKRLPPKELARFFAQAFGKLITLSGLVLFQSDVNWVKAHLGQSMRRMALIWPESRSYLKCVQRPTAIAQWAYETLNTGLEFLKTLEGEGKNGFIPEFLDATSK